jgi:hypothetical protein
MLYTHETRTDGFGAQYQTIITTILWCKENHKNYLYSGLNRVEHNYNNDPNYTNLLENIINLKDNFKYRTNNTIEIKFSNIRNEFENNIDYYCNSETMKFIKDCFWKNKEKDQFKNNKMNIAVQIRRANSHDNGHAGPRATTPNTYYLNIMNEIRDKYTDKELLFHIYSQGKQNNFKELNREDVVFHLDEDISTTFTGMVASDILITSPSSFSYVAALLSDGIIYYKPFWHNPKKTWNIRN